VSGCVALIDHANFWSVKSVKVLTPFLYTIFDGQKWCTQCNFQTEDSIIKHHNEDTGIAAVTPVAAATALTGV
jgi:C4-type Zn-finger protein